MKIVATQSADGYHFNGLLSETANSKKIIIHIHGMAGSLLLNQFYTSMHDYYPQHGVSFLVGELRGSGTITTFAYQDKDRVCGNAYEKFEDSVYDIQSWVDLAKNLGFEEIWLQAHSLGPSKVAYYLQQKQPHEIKGVIFISPSDMLGLVHDPAGKKDHDILLPEAKKLASSGLGQSLLSHKLWGDVILSADTYLNFFDTGANTAIFNYNDESLGWDVVNNITIPVLAITGTKDDGIVPVADPHQAMKKLEQELKNSPRVKTIVYKEAQHSFDGYGDKIVQDAIAFINN